MPRADAVENRARILEAAVAALAVPTPVFSLNAIAKQAGVGIGTLYRHFPTREALLVEVYRSELEQLVASADELLAVHTPFDALAEWLDRFTLQGRAKAGFSDVLANLATHEQLAQESYAPIMGALSRLLDANERAGTVRSSVDPDDLVLMLTSLWRVPLTPEGDAQAARMLRLVLDGLADPTKRTRGRMTEMSDRGVRTSRR